MFDIVLPTYNNLEELKHCLKALENQTFKEFKVFVCVDGSTDGTVEHLSTVNYKLDLKVLEHSDKKNKGRNLTRNLSIPYLSNEYILMIDTDCVPKPNLVEKHKETLENSDVVSVGEVYYVNTRTNIWAKYLMTRGKGRFEDKQEIPSHYLNTQNVAFKTKYFLESGGQDLEMSNSYGGDDTELGYRLHKLYGIKTVFNKSAAVFSDLDKNLNKALSQMEEFGERNLKLIRKKHPEFKNVFRVDLFEGKSFSKKVFRFLLNTIFSKIVKLFLFLVPGKLKMICVHYLVFAAIYKGYSKV